MFSGPPVENIFSPVENIFSPVENESCEKNNLYLQHLLFYFTEMEVLQQI